MVTVGYCDGASRGNPGRAGCGAVLHTRRYTHSRKQYVGDSHTNNEAEYEGLLLLLRLARDKNVRDLIVRMDSELVVQQMNGRYSVHSERLQDLKDAADRLVERFDSVEFEWVQRGENTQANELANQAIDEISPTDELPPLVETYYISPYFWSFD